VENKHYNNTLKRNQNNESTSSCMLLSEKELSAAGAVGALFLRAIIVVVEHTTL